MRNSEKPARAALLVLALALSGCGIGGPAHQAAAPNAAAVVDMGFTSFSIASVTIRAGETVEWRNTSLITHTVTDDPKLTTKAQDSGLPAGARPFNSGDIPAGDIYTHRFDVPGMYRYACLHHEADNMLGVVIVKPAP